MTLRVNQWHELPRAIAISAQAGAIGLSYLLRALYNGRIALLPMLPATPRRNIRTFIGETRGRPAVILIGDDDGADRGPAGWPMATHALNWAASVIIHASGGEEHHYELGIKAAETSGKSLIIECSTATAKQWVDAVQRLPKPPPTLVVWPREGVHPVAPERLQ